MEEQGEEKNAWLAKAKKSGAIREWQGNGREVHCYGIARHRKAME